MQEQDKEFKIGQKVRYLGGDDWAFQEPNSEGFIINDLSYWEGCVEVEFEKGLNNNLTSYSQIILKSCLEVVE